MAHLWIRTDEGWAAAALEDERYALTGDRSAPLRRAPGAAAVLLLRHGERDWAVLCGPGGAARVNGIPVRALRSLQHRDELRVVGGARCYFSTERRAKPEPYPGAKPTPCARCKRPVEPGRAAVRCPTCELWHHADDPPCWTYAPRCAGCEHETADAGTLRWTPEGL